MDLGGAADIPIKAKSTTVPVKDDPEVQSARSFLRRRFLHFLIAVAGHKMAFTMHEHTSVSAEFGMMDIDVRQIQVSDLVTPIGVQKEAILRTNDVIAMQLTVDGGNALDR